MTKKIKPARALLRKKMSDGMTEFESFFKKIENANTISTNFPEETKAECDKILSICDLITKNEIPLSKIEKLEWNAVKNQFIEHITRLRDAESENEKSTGQHNVLDSKNHESYYFPVTTGDIVEWINQNGIWNRVTNLLHFGLVGMKKDEYEELESDREIDCSLNDCEY